MHEVLAAQLRRTRLLVDAGAGRGRFTRRAARLVRGGEILAVEADPLRSEALARDCARLGASARIEVVHAALGERPGPVFLPGPGLQRRRVPGTSLDALLPDREPDLVRLGAEVDGLGVLRGAKRLLRWGHTRFWLTSPQPGSREELRDFLRPFGYYASSFQGEGALLVHRDPWLAARTASSRALALLQAACLPHR